MAKRSASNGSGAASPSAIVSTPAGSESELPSVPADVLEIMARLLGVGALQVLYVRDGIAVKSSSSDWKFGPAQWLLVQLPLGDMDPDGAIHRAEKQTQI